MMCTRLSLLLAAAAAAASCLLLAEAALVSRELTFGDVDQVLSAHKLEPADQQLARVKSWYLETVPARARKSAPIESFYRLAELGQPADQLCSARSYKLLRAIELDRGESIWTLLGETLDASSPAHKQLVAGKVRDYEAACERWLAEQLQRLARRIPADETRTIDAFERVYEEHRRQLQARGRAAQAKYRSLRDEFRFDKQLLYACDNYVGVLGPLAFPGFELSLSGELPAEFRRAQSRVLACKFLLARTADGQ